MQCQDIIRMANSIVAEFGNEAEPEVERKIAGCMMAHYVVMAGIWREVGATIAQIRADEAAMASSVGRERSIEPQS